MYIVFNKVLQSDMGKTIVRKYAQTLDAQSVIELWTFTPLFFFFNMFNQCFQDASAWETEGLVLKV